jgi:hypothetical protein
LSSFNWPADNDHVTLNRNLNFTDRAIKSSIQRKGPVVDCICIRFVINSIIDLFWSHINSNCEIFHSVKDGIFHSTRLFPRGMQNFIFHRKKVFCRLHLYKYSLFVDQYTPANVPIAQTISKFPGSTNLQEPRKQRPADYKRLANDSFARRQFVTTYKIIKKSLNYFG